MKVLKVTLKQHTPLIHFQHDQYGATLRASEVKPKLDKYIIAREYNNDYEKCKYYLVGYKFSKKETEEARIKEEEKLNNDLKFKFEKSNYRALKYKVKITSKIVAEYLISSNLNRRGKSVLNDLNIKFLSNTLYFAQEEKNNEIIGNKDVSLWNNIGSKGIMLSNIELNVVGDNHNVGIIAKHIQSFFLYENFGNRQNKGFGCFEVTGIYLDNDSNSQQLKSNEELLKKNFLFCYKKVCKSNNLNVIFSTITKDYKILKSGDSSRNIKSKLMLYFLKQIKRNLGNRILWEKDFFRKNSDDKYQKIGNEKYHLKGHYTFEILPSDSFKYIRALLGVANQYEFLLMNPPMNNMKNKLVISVDGGKSGVERFKSPITFKVLDNCIYLVGNQINRNILNKEFNYFIKIKSDPRYDNSPINDSLRIPESFDLNGFIQWAMNINMGYKLLEL